MKFPQNTSTWFCFKTYNIHLTMSPSVELDSTSERPNCLICKTTPIGTGKTKYCSKECQQKAQQQARKERKATSRIANLETKNAPAKTPSATMPNPVAASPLCIVCNRMPRCAGDISYCSTVCRNRARKGRKAAIQSSKIDASGADEPPYSQPATY